MNWTIAVRGVMTRTVVVVALVGAAATGTCVAANATPGAPTGPSDTACISMPTDPVCAGGPYAIPSPPPMVLPPAAPIESAPIGGGMSGMPGSI
ncbi:hypothetical protein M1247_03650 [Mycobacterium sp. 21AC1]|uniref:hypothetical protein n=1 Tax=[Mycobacterium] appelbergii TaxID=2939269 RepID=UPI002939092F|nr:hypothetical protein [Mycobacterium sp. 21AC1]MDV3123999.1 hypothetical protein [Mycobacterium sp. 21AC1]